MADDRWDHEADDVPDEPNGDGSDEDAAIPEAAEVACPHCGEWCTIPLDAGGGARQDYVEDCQVCCRPWVVHVRLDGLGGAEVWADAADE